MKRNLLPLHLNQKAATTPPTTITNIITEDELQEIVVMMNTVCFEDRKNEKTKNLIA